MSNYIVIIMGILTLGGILKGILRLKEIFTDSKGKSIEQIRQEEKERSEMEWQKERDKFESNFYIITHPVGYMNMNIKSYFKSKKKD